MPGGMLVALVRFARGIMAVTAIRDASKVLRVHLRTWIQTSGRHELQSGTRPVEQGFLRRGGAVSVRCDR